jgi:hypothetical protein
MPGKRNGLIVFDDGSRIYTQSTVEQINDVISTVTASRIPLIKVLDENGAELWINADHIRAFHRGGAVQLEERGDAVPIEGVQTDSGQSAKERPAGRVPFRLARRHPDR